VRPMEEVSSLINCLTSNEDMRQELWVHYLGGNSVDSFASYLQKISFEYSEDTQLREAIWQLINNPPSNKLASVLKEFSDFERSIICLLMLGQDVGNISAIKGINQVRIRQTISSIRYNSVWDKYYGTEEKSDGLRKARSK